MSFKNHVESLQYKIQNIIIPNINLRDTCIQEIKNSEDYGTWIDVTPASTKSAALFIKLKSITIHLQVLAKKSNIEIKDDFSNTFDPSMDLILYCTKVYCLLLHCCAELHAKLGPLHIVFTDSCSLNAISTFAKCAIDLPYCKIILFSHKQVTKLGVNIFPLKEYFSFNKAEMKDWLRDEDVAAFSKFEMPDNNYHFNIFYNEKYDLSNVTNNIEIVKLILRLLKKDNGVYATIKQVVDVKDFRRADFGSINDSETFVLFLFAIGFLYKKEYYDFYLVSDEVAFQLYDLLMTYNIK